MPLPNFFLIGAVKAGTSSLYRYLGQHPEVFMCPEKEPFFFADDFHDAHLRQTGERMVNREEYERLFSGCAGVAAVGEASPHYLCSVVAPSKIKALVPSARLLAVLRDPAERAFSAYLHLRREQHEPLDDFEDALAAEHERMVEGRLPIWYYRAAGRYYEQVVRYREQFATDQLWIGLYDDFSEHPASFTQEMYGFLGVADDFTPDVSLRFNPSGLPRSQRAFAVLTTENRLRRSVARAIPMRLREPLRVKMINRVLVKPELTPDVRGRLVGEYRDDVERLGELLDRDLSAWLR